MGVRSRKVFQVVSGWQAVEIFVKCLFIGMWQLFQIALKTLWKGHRRKLRKISTVELSVDSSIGTHCYIKIMDVKYHYTKIGPQSGNMILVLGDAPDSGNLWSPTWSRVVKRLSESGYQVVTLDLRGTGGSEVGTRRDLSPPQVVDELSTLMEALGVSDVKPAVVIGFGIGGMLTWYLAHSYGPLIRKFVVVGAPHPNLYWQYPPTEFCRNTLHFIQWPYFPERWMAEGKPGGEDRTWTSTRACDWMGALNYVRGAAWYKIHPSHRIEPPGLLVGSKESATALVTSAHYCLSSTLRLVSKPDPTDLELPSAVFDFLIAKEKSIEDVPRGRIMGLIGAVAGRGRELTARLVLPPTQA